MVRIQKLRKAIFFLTFFMMLGLALLSLIPEAAIAGTPVEQYIYFPLISRLKGGQGTVPGL